MKTNEIREKYLLFFETKGCVRRSSDVLVPRWDPSVLFTPAGMNQFKDHFLGRCKLDFTRATTCQKCLRTGDIDNVGRTAFHHTFFEMLGNFSFGDYFKREAIHWAWEFLTDSKWLGINPEKLSATVYKDDHEAALIWLDEIKLSQEKLQYLDEDENFWPASAPSQGPDGVCGPCSEIYYKTPQGEVEIWNLVFTQFNRVGNPPDNLRPLPSKNIDTGMGLERISSVMQNVETNYHIDILRPLVEAAGDICSIRYNGDDLSDENGRRLRRIADHIRACSFAVHENVYPGNKEEKYVIRRLLRRAVLDGVQMGQKNPFLFQLVPVVADLMKDPYPELSETIERVQSVISAEEAHFIGTIDSGLNRIENVFHSMQNQKRVVVSGTEAFEMYQTYGFPPELFEIMAAEHHFGFDWDGFAKEMQHHGELSGLAEKNLLFKHDPLEGIKKVSSPPEFLGYETTICEDAKILAIVTDGKLVDSLNIVPTTSSNDKTSQPETIIVLDKTPFYGEKGGQVGDSGEISGENFIFNVSTAQYDGEFIVHSGALTSGRIAVGDKATATVNQERRAGISRAHSATHLLHCALRKYLGAHAEQQGSKVDADVLRFDFTNHKGVDAETLMKIETEVNRMILQSLPITCDLMPLEEARKVGAMMLFGEKYPDVVRVVRMGASSELCGGTHLTNTGQIGLCKIISEESVSAGTRRITAVTGMESLARIQKMESIAQSLAGMLRVPTDEILLRVESLVDAAKKLRKQLETITKRGELSIESIIEGAEEIQGVKVILWAAKNSDINALREAIDQIRRKTKSAAVILANVQLEEGKVTLLAGLTHDLVEKGLNAVDWVKFASRLIQGGGGGRPDMAQAGGKKPEAVLEAFNAAKQWISERL
ncbi:MAG: alanine--tRNA ligase [Planctomycetia bacterium]|nr:alanine--tRNA ligase [Planctomycetia bacterium]